MLACGACVLSLCRLTMHALSRGAGLRYMLYLATLAFGVCVLSRQWLAAHAFSRGADYGAYILLRHWLSAHMPFRGMRLLQANAHRSPAHISAASLHGISAYSRQNPRPCDGLSTWRYAKPTRTYAHVHDKAHSSMPTYPPRFPRYARPRARFAATLSTAAMICACGFSRPERQFTPPRYHWPRHM